MTNSLTVYTEFDNIQRAAVALQASGYFADVQTKAQAIVKVMAGAELGLPPFASMTGIHIIKGKPVLSANLIATLIKQHPDYDYRVSRMDDDGVVVQFYERGQKVGESSFTMEDAKRANLLSNPTWKSYPRNMLFARALSNGARWYAPGVFGGAPVYTAEELGADHDADGYVIEGTISAEPTPPPPSPKPATNGKAPPEAHAGPLPDDEQAISETPVGGFVGKVLEMLPYYKAARHVGNTIKQLGYEALPDDAAGRVGLYRALKEHATQKAETN